MNIRLVVFYALLPLSLSATGPVISRYIPSFISSSAQTVQMPSLRPTFSVTTRNGHASNSSSFVNEPQEMYKFDGLMEMGGLYDFHEMACSAKEAVPGIVSPFYRETGADTLASRQLLFGAQSSVSYYGLDLTAELPLSSRVKCGFTVPLFHVEARQRYDFPILSADNTVSFAQVEQTHRLRQLLHQDLGMVQKDWIVNSIGDLSGWIEYAQSWSYIWLLRTLQVGGRLSISAPVAKTEDVAYPASFALGNPGSWGIGLSLVPRAEIKEAIWLQSPVSLVVQTPSLRTQRLPVYGEPLQFGVLQGLVRTVPGITVSWEPTVFFQHFIDNLHLFGGISIMKHYSDAMSDRRTNQATPSYLTRTTVPQGSHVGIPGGIDGSLLASKAQAGLAQLQQVQKKIYSNWQRTYLMLGVQYELVDLFAGVKYAPTLNLNFNYCVGATRAARMHQISAGLSWRF